MKLEMTDSERLPQVHEEELLGESLLRVSSDEELSCKVLRMHMLIVSCLAGATRVKKHVTSCLYFLLLCCLESDCSLGAYQVGGARLLKLLFCGQCLLLPLL
jgi:hypothetical protein